MIIQAVLNCCAMCGPDNFYSPSYGSLDGDAKLGK
jgi:hypothetical protein